MPLKREQSNPETERSMSPEEQPTPPDSPKSTALSTPSSFRLADLYRSPIQTIIEVEDEIMEEGETTDSDSSMEEGQIADTRQLLRSWALPPIFSYFPPFYSALPVTCSPLVPSCAARTVTKSPDKSPDGPPDHSAVRYHMPSLRSPQHSAASPFNPLWIASSLPRHDRLPAHDGAILRTASS